MIKKIPIDIIDIPPKGCHIICRLKMRKRNYTFIIDTGASMTVMDKNRYISAYPENDLIPYKEEFTGIGDAGNVSVYTGFIDDLAFGNVKCNSVEVILIDLENINKAYARYDLPKIDGILGGDLLKRLKAGIDYGGSVMTILNTCG